MIKSFLGTIRGKLVFFISCLLLAQLAVSFLSFYIFVSQFVQSTSGQKALNLAIAISKMKSVNNALLTGSNDIQIEIENIRTYTDAAFIVVANKDGIRLTHPNPEMIGKKFVGGDYFDAINKKRAYISSSIGTLGPSIRAFAPVINNNDVIGFVSVGYLKETIFHVIFNYMLIGLFFVFMMFIVAFTAVIFISNHIKKITLNLEPKEIASLYIQRETIFNSLREGIIAVDNELNIYFVNNSAISILESMKTSLTNFINKISNKYFINNKLIGDYVKDLEFAIGDTTLLLNISKLEYNNIASGFVFSFRRKDEIDALKNEILSLKKMSEILRTQSHEYSNKLHIIAGLIQLGEYEEASNLIISESRQFQSFMKFIDEKINDKYISALLISKMSKAGEIGCKLLFNENSTGIASPVKNSDILVTAIGNIIDNAIEAASSHNRLNAIVELTFNSDKDYVEIIVEDNGPGIQNTEKILESGYSTKGSNRGLGLSIAKNIFDRFNASVDISFSKKYKGAMFRISFKNQDAL